MGKFVVGAEEHRASVRAQAEELASAAQAARADANHAERVARYLEAAAQAAADHILALEDATSQYD